MQNFTVYQSGHGPGGRYRKLLKIMKAFTFIMFVCCMHASATVYSQNINLSEKNIALSKLLGKIEEQSGLSFFYNISLLKNVQPISISLKNAEIGEALSRTLSGTQLSYEIIDKTVVISKRPERQPQTVIRTKDLSILHGKVTDKSGKPLSGVTITAKGTGQKEVFMTDNLGIYTIVIAEGNTSLIFSYTGYHSKTIEIGNQKVVNVILEENISDLDQVQIRAYGTTTMRTSTSTIIHIGADEIAKSPARNVLEIIKNRVPGVFIQQNTGLPGGSFDVKIRGESSFSGNSPLFIIDGVAFPAGSTLPIGKPGGNRDQFLGGNALNYLNPSDFESIDILKDADATAVYGSRGAYGVILITTKRGKEGKPRLNVNSSTGISTRGSYPEMLGLEDYLTLRREALKNDGLSPGPTDLDINGVWPADRYTDWQKELLGGNGLTNATNISYSGGNGSTNFLIAANYNRQGSTNIGKGSNRGGGLRFNINNLTPNKKLFFGLTGSFNSTLNDAFGIDQSGSGITAFAPNAAPLILPNGNLNWDMVDENPLAALNISYRGVTNNLQASTEVKYEIFDGFALQAQLGYNLLMGDEFRATPTTAFNPGVNNIAKTTSYANNYSIRTFNIDPYLRYRKAVGRGVILITTGLSLQDQINTEQNITGTNFPTDALLSSPANATTVISTYGKATARQLRFFGLANYNYEGRYIINLSYSREGSTKFGENNRWGNFGSAGAAWVISEEKWVKNNLGFLSFAKINGSYGITGGDQILNFSYLNKYNTTPDAYQGKIGFLPGAPANADLRWELTKKAALDLTLEFLKGRLGLIVSTYKNISTDLLISQPVSTTTGFASYILNSPAKIENKGFDFIINSKNLTGKFTWSTRFNITLDRNKLLSYPGIEVLNSNFNYEVGKSLGNRKVFNYAGVDPATGNYFFTTKAGVTGQNLFTLNLITDKYASVDLTPKYYGSIGNTFTYKNIALDFTFGFRKRTGMNYLAQQTIPPGVFNTNSSVAFLRRWQKPGDITDVPKVSTGVLVGIFGNNNYRQSTGAYETITYASLQNVNLSYNFPEKFLQRTKLAALSFYVQGANLLYLSKYKDMNPEALSVTATPPLRTFTAGFNITF